MVSVCLPSDALLQHLPSYLGFSYLARAASLHGCSSKAQPLLLTLDEGYLLTATFPDLQCGIAPLGPPVPAQPPLLRLLLPAIGPGLGRGWLLPAAATGFGLGWLLWVTAPQQWPQDWKRSVFIPIPKKGNAKECSNYCTIAHASKEMLKILQARLQQYMNHETSRCSSWF